MESYDKVVAIFESNNLNIEEFKKNKFARVFGNNKVIKKLDKQTRDKIKQLHELGYKELTYNQLIEMEQEVYDLNSKDLLNRPTNPFRYTREPGTPKYYLWDCTFDYNGKAYYLKQLSLNSRLDRSAKDDCIQTALSQWEDDTFKYIDNTNKNLINYLEDNYYGEDSPFHKLNVKPFHLVLNIGLVFSVIFSIVFSISQQQTIRLYAFILIFALFFVILRTHSLFRIMDSNVNLRRTVNKYFKKIKEQFSKTVIKLKKSKHTTPKPIKGKVAVRNNIVAFSNQYIKGANSKFIRSYKYRKFRTRVYLVIYLLLFILAFLNYLG